MPGPGSVASSASSRVAAAAASAVAPATSYRSKPAAAGTGGGGGDSSGDEDNGIPLSVLHMISNKDNVRDDVNHADLFAKLREEDERRPPSRNSSASSLRAPDEKDSKSHGDDGGDGGHRRRHKKRHHKHHHSDDKRDDDDQRSHKDRDDAHVPEVPLSPRSALRRKGTLLQELYMHIGQINSQVNPTGPSAPIRSLDMNATLEEVELEVERAKSAVGQLRAIKFMRKGLVTIASAAEFTNKRFNPWPLELDGFADFLTSGIGDYDACFAKLYDKYKGRSQEMPPELELLMLLGSSAFMFHLSKSFAKSAMANANFSAAVANAMAAQQQQPQPQPRATTAAVHSSFNDAASVAGTTVSQQFDEARLVERLKKSKMLPDNVTKLSKA